MAIVYRHRRLDTNEVFYIGIGKEEKRAYNKSRRSNWWKSVVKKTDYKIDILTEDITWEKACELEIILINYYGRKDKGIGSLVNLTDGGDGNSGGTHLIGRKATKEEREVLRLSHLGIPNKLKGTKLPKEWVDKLKSANRDKQKKWILDTQIGIYYLGFKEASEAYCISENYLRRMMCGARLNKTNLILTQDE